MRKTLKYCPLIVIFFAIFLFVPDISGANADVSAGKIIVSVTEARVRASPSLKAKVLGFSKLGTVYEIIGTRGAWYNITFNGVNSGWVSNTIVEPFVDARRGAIYQKFADKYLGRLELDFATGSELSEFLTNIQYEVAGTSFEPDLALKRLIALSRTLDSVQFEKHDQGKYQMFVQANESDIVFSDPAGQYFVIADRYWDLAEKFKKLPIAEEIAWNAAQIGLPGECEGYLICHLGSILSTDVRYLKLYPNGKHSRVILESIANYLGPMAEDAENNDDSGYYLTSEPEDRTMLQSTIGEMREGIEKASGNVKTQILNLLNTIENGYRSSEGNDEGLVEFWDEFRKAVLRKDKNAVASLSKFPLEMPHLQKPVESKDDFLKRYDQIFNGETDAVKCFVSATLNTEDGRFGVYCGFKAALNSDNKPIYYRFEKQEQGWKFVGLDNINE